MEPSSFGQNADLLQEPPADLNLPSPSTAAENPNISEANLARHKELSDELAALSSFQSRPASSSPLWSGRARESTVVRGRQGSVLTRGLVLKTDYFEGSRVRPTHLDLSLQGGPNFRKADAPLEVYGVAQPTITGLKTILTALDATPLTGSPLSTSPRHSRTFHRTPSHDATNRPSRSPVTDARPSFRRSASGQSFTSPERRRIPRSPDQPRSASRHPEQEPRQTVWVCTREEPILYIGARPFVLREHSSPTISFSLSSRAENLEAIERRLKQDVLLEAKRFGGLIMVHEEEGDADKPHLHPTWIAVDRDTIKTVREVFDDLRDQGWRCDYHRVPIGRDQPIENNYLDAYTRILRNLDPTRTCVVANCGAGFTRTTFAMVAAQIIRRRQLMLMGYQDPFQLSEASASSVAAAASGVTSPVPTPVGKKQDDKAARSMANSLRATYEKQAHAQALLRLVQLLSEAGAESPVDLLLGSPNLLDSLRRALTGDFNVIRALCGILDEGLDDKVVVDLAIDSAAHLTNLREVILLERVSYALAGTDTAAGGGAAEVAKPARAHHLDKAVRALELYFFLCAFASYVSGSQKAVFEHSFADWLKTRSEIWNTIRRIRTKGKQLYLFDPVADLSQLSSSAALAGRSRLRLGITPANLFGTERSMAGDEFAEHHIRNLRSGIILRQGTLLKEDVWQAQREARPTADVLPIRGAINFRRIPGTAIFASGQPTVDGIRNVIASIAEQVGEQQDDTTRPISCTWLNLREEPLIYIAGKPYVLRDSTVSLRNTKAYGGISWTRLQLLEDRLKSDVINELEQNDGRLLLHSENADGEVFPQWKEVQADDVATLQDVMTTIARELQGGVSISLGPEPSSAQATGELTFRRIPFTAERPPDFEDMGTLLQTVLRAHGSSIINNCQLGRGRSTLASVIVLLISQWLHKHSSTYAGPADSSLLSESIIDEVKRKDRSRASYHLINSLLRVIPHGLQVKEAVDDAIDRAGSVMNLRDSIEESRIAAEEIEEAENPLRKQRIAAGCQALRRYFSLIVFQAYLNATRPDTFQSMQTFETFVRRQPVLQTIGKELDKVDLALITPLHRMEAADGMALDDEVNEVVANRDGAILTAYTMLKSDFFSGIAKVHLSQIEGIPNLRSIPLLVGGESPPPEFASSEPPLTPLSLPGRETWGSGMPTLDGLRRGLDKMGADRNGETTVVWTSLREEPVVYVRGRPHVLRLADQPLTNLEATGITTDTVERQEIALKNDVIQEAARREGRILLHDEVELEPGKFDIIPVWESIKEGDVLTPREAYELVQSEGYQVDYARVAVTDEQAPVPAVFSEIERRVLKALSRGSATAFNCQMGRGRTTTGMVIASLISTVSHLGEELFIGGSSEIGSEETSALGSGSGSGSGSRSGSSLQYQQQQSNLRMEGAKDLLDNREDELWLQGEYRMTLQLVGVLSHGKLAKKLTDAAIDRMDAVQNLRKAIYDSKLRAENAEPRSKKRAHLSAVYKNYLQRYAFLIAFANYLVEKSRANIEERRRSLVDDDASGGDAAFDDAASVATATTTTTTFGPTDQFPSFLAWLKPRREVESIIRHLSDDEVGA